MTDAVPATAVTNGGESGTEPTVLAVNSATESTSQESMEVCDSQPVVGEFYSALKPGQGWRKSEERYAADLTAVYSLGRAEVIAFRYNELVHGTEYFVHFDGDDRRMDTWIPGHMIDTTKRRTSESPEVKKGEAALENIQGAVTRSQRLRLEENDAYPYYGMDPETYVLEKEREKVSMEIRDDWHDGIALQMTRIKHVSQIHYGGYLVQTWYYSPYAGKYGLCPRLYVCDRCFKYVRHLRNYQRHRSHCTIADVPGKEVYRKDNLLVLEVNGEDKSNKKTWVYCQNVCLLSKLFLDHKTVCYDAEPFWFYVLYECSADGPKAAGYFSKEKWPCDNNNLSCITVFPPHQRKGYGSFLIQFSYLLSKIAGFLGGPERPLSDIGRKSYRTFWTWKIVEVLKENSGVTCTLKDLSECTGILQSDIVETLRSLKIPYFYRGVQAVRFSEATLASCMASRMYRIPLLIADPAYLKDVSHLQSRGSKKNRRSSVPIVDDGLYAEL